MLVFSLAVATEVPFNVEQTARQLGILRAQFVPAPNGPGLGVNSTPIVQVDDDTEETETKFRMTSSPSSQRTDSQSSADHTRVPGLATITPVDNINTPTGELLRAALCRCPGFVPITSGGSRISRWGSADAWGGGGLRPHAADDFLQKVCENDTIGSRWGRGTPVVPSRWIRQ